MTEQTWVINASPLILLGKINQLELAERLASRLIVPKSVLDEVAAGAQDRSMQSTLLSDSLIREALRKVGE